MSRNSYVYVGNHVSTRGIEDYLKALHLIFSVANKSLVVINSFPPSNAELCIVIECFSDKPRFQLDSLYKYLESHKILKVLLHTEFYGPNGILNCFSPAELAVRSTLGFIPTFFYSYRCSRYFGIYALILPFLYFIMLPSGLSFSDFKKTLYWSARSMGLRRYFRRHDFHVCLSDDVYKCLLKNTSGISSIQLMPLINHPNILCTLQYLKERSAKMIFMSGAMTSYRRIYLGKLVRSIGNYIDRSKLELIESKSSLCQILGDIVTADNVGKPESHFANALTYICQPNLYQLELLKASKEVKSGSLLLLEIYVGQTKFWPFLSPMRVIRSLNQGIIPITFGRYTDTSLSQLTLSFKSVDEFMYTFEESMAQFISTLMERIMLYNESARSCNTRALEQFDI